MRLLGPRPCAAHALRKLVLSTVLLGACQSGRDPAAAQELADLETSIDALRNAPNQLKGPALRDLRAVPCAHFCELKSRCVEAYAEHLAVLSEIRALKVQLSGMRADGDVQLSGLKVRLDAAHQATLDCAASQGEIHRHARRALPGQ